MSLFPYYGGKGALVGRYPAPYYDHIIEPFAGGANYALRHGARRRVTLYELDAEIAAMWRWLIAATAADLLALPVLRLGERVASLRQLTDAERRFLAMWAHPGTQGADKVTGRGETAGWARHRERVAAEVHLVDHWTVVEANYAEAHDVTATWFIDPPYQGGGGDGYRHGARSLDYAALGEWTRSRSGQVIGCDHQGATWLPFRPLVAQQSQANTDDRLELVYLQGPQPMTDRLGRVQRRRRPGEMIMRYSGGR